MSSLSVLRKTKHDTDNNFEDMLHPEIEVKLFDKELQWMQPDLSHIHFEFPQQTSGIVYVDTTVLSEFIWHLESTNAKVVDIWNVISNLM